MKTRPEPKEIQDIGRRVARAPPSRALRPSTNAKARIAPEKTEIGDCLAERVTAANWVLSPSSAKATRASDDAKGTISMAYEG